MTKPLKNVIAAIDFDDTTDAVWDMALGLDLEAATLHVCHVSSSKDAEVRKDPEHTSKELEAAHARIQEIVRAKLGTPDNPLCKQVEIHVAIGSAPEQIVQLATDVSADLIVLGTREKKGLTRLFLGSVSTAVFREAPCSVLVARVADYGGLEKAPEIEPALTAGQGTMKTTRPVMRYRSQPFATYNANLFPTGIPRKQVY